MPKPPTQPAISKMFKMRHRSCLIFTTLFVIMLCIVILMIMGPELSTEQSLTQRLAECHMRLQYLESLHRARQEVVTMLSQYLNLIQNTTAAGVGGATALSNNNYLNTTAANAAPLIFGPYISNLFESLSPEARQILKNVSSAHATNNVVRMPTAYNLLPHLLDDPASLQPAYLRTKGRTDVSIVLGIPHVVRDKQSYLLGTLKNLIENMNEQEQNETLIIVYIGETDAETVQQVTKQLEEVFGMHIESGLIDVVVPAPSYYPNFEKLRITLKDSLERVKWRSKQNLDYAYLMAYAQSRGTFYVQLEDDILAKRNFITTMKDFAITKSMLTKPDQASWFVLDFCQLGFIGKMFKSAELPYMITFFQMFYNDKPVDWLLPYFLESKVCRMDQDQKSCNQERGKYWLHYRPSLFQHIGTRSSLKGKVQKLKDKQFGKVRVFFPHTNNPPAQIKTDIAAYRNYVLKRAYKGEAFFWGLMPQPGDLAQFIFEQPQQLRHFLFRSGNSEHPSDRFYNTTVEVLPLMDARNENTSAAWSVYNTTNDGYYIVGAFDAVGVAEGTLDANLSAIKELRLHVHSDSENWALLSEIELQTVAGNEMEQHKSTKKSS